MGRVFAILLCALLAPSLVAQSTRAKDLAAGKLLVASRDLGDPNFAETVVLLVHYDAEGVVGLVINRRTRITLSQALDEVKGAKNRSDRIYSGGPVGRNAVLALRRSHDHLDDAERVFGDVYLISKAESLSKAIEAEPEPDALHVYVGYAGWTPKQLEAELSVGAWFIFSGDAQVVFANNPEAVWTRLIEKTEEHVAALRTPAP
jgi:putative transcriptional regulator